MKQKLDQPINVSITPGTIISGVLILFGFYTLYLLRDLIMVILTAIIIASAIEPATRFLLKYKIPRVLGVLSVYLGIIFVMVGMFAVFLPPLIDDFRELTTTFPQYIESVTLTRIEAIPGFDNLLKTVTDGAFTSDIVHRVTSTFSGATFGFITAASTVFGGLLSFLLIVVISFYLAVQEDGVENLIKVFAPVKHERYVIDLWKRSQAKIGLWMQGQLVLALLIGILTYLGLSILGVSNPTFLAFIAAILELIPIFGPILAAVPAIGLAFIDGGTTLVLLTLGLYVIIQQFESQLIHPLVVRKIVGIPALLAIVSLIIGATVAGFLGIIIAVPVTAAVMEFLSDVEKKKKIEMDALESKQ